MSYFGAEPSNVAMNNLDGTSVDLPDWQESTEGVFVNLKDDLGLKKSYEGADSVVIEHSCLSADTINLPEEIGTGSVCNQKCLSNAFSKELQKSEVLKSVDGLSADLVDETTLESDDHKSAFADEHFTTKFAHLKINCDGKLDPAVVSKIMQDSPVYEEPEFNINRAHLRKSSSLKASKTPPGTPSIKKMVRFADALGLDLESIRTVLDADNPPRIPDSAIAGLEVDKEDDHRDIYSPYLDLLFQQPGAASNFLERVVSNKVALENCVVTGMNINGMVRVANIGYHKCVRIRYTINNWVTFYDIMASYVQNSCDVTTDRFSFMIVAPNTLGPGSKISFAVSFTVNDSVYWDSNYGKNYEVLCCAKAAPSGWDYCH